MSNLLPYTSAHAPTCAAQARFFRPPLPEGYVARADLCLRMEAGLQGRLILLSAPAGFGKSTLAVEFCERLPVPWHRLWLGLSERDKDPGRFFERLIDGLQQFYPDVGEGSLALLKMRQRHQPFAYEPWLDELIDDLGQHFDETQPLLLVLDDYHLAQGVVLDRCLQFFLNHAPAGVILLVTSRQRPDWHLARLRLGRQLLELTDQDLRLNQREVEALMRECGQQWDADQVRSIALRSEGWVAGLRLWLLAGEPSPLQVPNGGVGLIRDYLLEEVIELQAPEVQQFLAQTACLDRFSAPLCDAIRDSHDSAAIIHHLQADQVFLVPLDEQGKWFRYHHLFSDLLKSRPVTEALPATAVHLRACRWYREQGQVDAAVEQALLAGQVDVAASLVQSFSEEQLLAEQNVAMLLRWKTNLPEALLASTPRLILLYGWALAMACQLDAAQELLSALARFLPASDADTQRSLLAQWQALDGLIARGLGERQRTQMQCREAIEGLPAERYGSQFMCLSALANLALIEGDVWQARALTRQALVLAQRNGNVMFEAAAHCDRGRALLARGEADRAAEEVRRGLELVGPLSDQRHYSVRARLNIYRGKVAIMLLDLDVARAKLEHGIAEAIECRDVVAVTGYCMIASLLARTGRLTDAFDQLSEAERLMHMWDVPAICYLGVVTLGKCELWMAQGNLELAQLWLPQLESAYATTTPPEFHPHLALNVALQLAHLDRLEGRLDQAAQRLRRLMQEARALDALLIAQHAHVALTQVYRQMGEAREAQIHLGHALEAASTGALWPLLALIEQHGAWLREQLAARAPGRVRDALLKHLPEQLTEDDPALDNVIADKLSSRELAVLQLIAGGCSNQEISERLFISLHTVKSHARHINSKLGVERRTQAVAKAKALGLLR